MLNDWTGNTNLQFQAKPINQLLTGGRRLRSRNLVVEVVILGSLLRTQKTGFHHRYIGLNQKPFCACM